MVLTQHADGVEMGKECHLEALVQKLLICEVMVDFGGGFQHHPFGESLALLS